MSLRAGRIGDALELEMKLQRRYEKEEELGMPQKIIEWVTRTAGVEANPPNGVYDYRAIHSLLKDGSVLCKLMNKLLEHIGLPKVSFRSTVKSSFVAIANIDNFCVAARNYGVPENCIFQSSDLYEGRKSQMLTVLNCLNQLGKVANSRGFPQFYEGVAPPKPDQD